MSLHYFLIPRPDCIQREKLIFCKFDRLRANYMFTRNDVEEKVPDSVDIYKVTDKLDEIMILSESVREENNGIVAHCLSKNEFKIISSSQIVRPKK